MLGAIMNLNFIYLGQSRQIGTTLTIDKKTTFKSDFWPVNNL